MVSAPHAPTTPESILREDSASRLNAKTTKSSHVLEPASVAPSTKEPTPPEESASRAHVVTLNTMTRRDSALTAQLAPDPPHQDSSAPPIDALQPKSSLMMVDANHAHDTSDQTQVQPTLVAKSAKKLTVTMTRLSSLMELVKAAQSGPSQCLEVESVDQMFVELVKGCSATVAANNAQTTPEEVVTSKSNSTPNVSQTNANETRSSPRREPASSADLTRELTPIRESVPSQHAVTEPASSSRMLLSRSAQPTPEQLKTASNASQTDAH